MHFKNNSYANDADAYLCHPFAERGHANLAILWVYCVGSCQLQLWRERAAVYDLHI